MQKSPALIIEEFEARQASERIAQKRRLGRLVRRSGEIGQIVIIMAAFFYFSDRKVTFLLPFAMIASGYLGSQLRHRWALEDRLEALEKKAQDKPAPAA